MPVLVLDEHLAGGKLVAALRDRGLDVRTLGDLGVTGRPDPDVVRRVDERLGMAWLLLTMDLTIVEDYPGFDWDRYAIAWVTVPDHLRGAPVETWKRNVVHRHLHEMTEQRRGDQHTYTLERHYKSRPSLNVLLRRKV